MNKFEGYILLDDLPEISDLLEITHFTDLSDNFPGDIELCSVDDEKDVSYSARLEEIQRKLIRLTAQVRRSLRTREDLRYVPIRRFRISSCPHLRSKRMARRPHSLTSNRSGGEGNPDDSGDPDSGDPPGPRYSLGIPFNPSNLYSLTPYLGGWFAEMGRAL